MNKHTPGPWKHWGYQVQVETKNIVEYHGLNMPEVIPVGTAFKQTRGAKTVPDQDACYANARLMAAAPEMLETLENLLDALRHSDVDDYDAAYGAAENAVNKAIGET